MEYACAALNARTNLTLYMGVNDEGKVTGIEVESYEQVSLLVPLFHDICIFKKYCNFIRFYSTFQIVWLADEINDYLHKPKFLGFKSGNRLLFSEEMRLAFGTCVGGIVAVPVEGAPDAEMQRYVLEIDIAPRASVCGRLIFSFCNSNGKAVSYIRDGSSNIESSQYQEKKGAKMTYEETVLERAELREKTDLKEKKKELLESIAKLESEEGHLLRSAERKLLDEFRKIVKEIDDELKKIKAEEAEELEELKEKEMKQKNEEREANKETVLRLLNFDIDKEMESVAPINMPLEAVRTIAARAWPSVPVEVPQDIGNIAEALSKQHAELERQLNTTEFRTDVIHAFKIHRGIQGIMDGPARAAIDHLRAGIESYQAEDYENAKQFFWYVYYLPDFQSANL